MKHMTIHRKNRFVGLLHVSVQFSHTLWITWRVRVCSKHECLYTRLLNLWRNCLEVPLEGVSLVNHVYPLAVEVVTTLFRVRPPTLGGVPVVPHTEVRCCRWPQIPFSVMYVHLTDTLDNSAMYLTMSVLGMLVVCWWKSLTTNHTRMTLKVVRVP